MNDTRQHNDEITLRELILLLIKYINECLKSWTIILAITLPFIFYFLYQYKTTPKQYEAKVTFMVEGTGTNNYGALSGLLVNIGVGQGGGGANNPYKILQVLKSQAIVNNVLFSKSSCSDDLVINEIIEIYNLNEKWAEKDEMLRHFRFEKIVVDSFTRTENLILKKVTGLLFGSSSAGLPALYKPVMNIETGTFNISSSTTKECLTIDLAKIPYTEISSFFENRVYDDLKQSRQLFKSKRDSLNNLIESKTIEIAQFQDRNKASVYGYTNAIIKQMSVELQGLASAYGEVAKNYEIADLNFRNHQPLFLIIDSPTTPIYPVGRGLVKSLLIGLILGLVVSVLLIVARLTIREALSGDNE